MAGRHEPAAKSSRILYVMAAEQEYGVHLRCRIEPLFCGVGPVEAGVTLAAELGRRQKEGRLPRLVVSLGSAGSRTLTQTEVYQVTSVSYRDMDASALGFERGVTPFLDIPAVVELQLKLSGIPGASLSTGANIVSGAGYDGIEADMVDMETFAHLRACQHFGVPLIGLRGISDGKADLNHIDDWTEYLHIVDEKLAAAVDCIEAAMADGTLLG